MATTTVARGARPCSNQPGAGRPKWAATIACEALVEAIVAVDDAEEHLFVLSGTLTGLAAHAIGRRRYVAAASLQNLAADSAARAMRLRNVVRPELERGYRAAEQLIAARRRVAA